MPRAVHVCDPGAPRDLTPQQMAERCKCRHDRAHHWWGGGACGECSRCDYFRHRKPEADATSTLPDSQQNRHLMTSASPPATAKEAHS